MHSTLGRWLLGMGLTVSFANVFAQPVQRQGLPPESTWPAVLEAARKEGSVVLYSQQVPALLARIQEDFGRQYPGIRLEVQRLAGQGVITKLDQERLSGIDGGDVAITVEIPWIEERSKEGGLRKPSGPSSRAWPARYLVFDAVPVIGLEPVVMAYNTNLIKNPVQGYADLLRPEFKGRLGVTSVAAIPQLAWYEWVEKTQGGDFLQRLSAQGARAYSGSVPITQAAAAGEIAAATFSVPTTVLPLIEKGAPLRMVIPNPSLGFSYYAAAMANSRRPNASQVLMDYLMSPRGQSAIHSRGESASPLPNIQGSADASTIQQLDPRAYSANSVNEYRKKWEGLFSR